MRAVLLTWRATATELVTSRLDQTHRHPKEQLKDLISLPFRGRSAMRAARIEVAVRAWARRDAMARSFVDEADTARLNYITRVFSDLGFDMNEAQHRAFVLYSHQITESLLHTHGDDEQRRQRRQFFEQLLLQNLEEHHF